MILRQGGWSLGRDAWSLKLTSSGRTKWLKNFGGKEYDDASAVIKMPDGGYALAGVTVSTNPPFQYLGSSQGCACDERPRCGSRKTGRENRRLRR